MRPDASVRGQRPAVGCSGQVAAEPNALLEPRRWVQVRAKDAMWSSAMSSATAIGSQL